MRIAELSERSGVGIPSIKFYLREGLLPTGEKTSANQSSYGDAHLVRLRIVRALIEVGGLSLLAAKSVLAAIDSESLPIDQAFGVAQRAASRSIPAADVIPGADARRAVDALIAERGWLVSPINPGRAITGRVIETYEQLGQSTLADTLGEYADAALVVARADLRAVGERGERGAMVETVVVGEALGDTLMAGLRRLAQEHVSRELFATQTTQISEIDIDCEDGTP
jgi:DNA-binding transcriptional MerR regulator